MAALLLDTDVCIHVLKGNDGVVARLEKISPDQIAVSVITVFELYTGASKSRRPLVEQTKVAAFLEPLTFLDFGKEEALVAAQLRASLEKKGLKIGPYDLLIAAQAVTSGLALVIGNMSEFRRVPGLLLEDWAPKVT